MTDNRRNGARQQTGSVPTPGRVQDAARAMNYNRTSSGYQRGFVPPNAAGSGRNPQYTAPYAAQPVQYSSMNGGTRGFSSGSGNGKKPGGKKTGLITNTFSDERDFIRASELYPLFDAALISYEQRICKPDPEMFRRMTERLGVEPGECLYVGDGGSRELFAARDAGMKAVQCTWFHDLAFEPHIPCPILDEFEQAGHPSEILRIAERD